MCTALNKQKTRSRKHVENDQYMLMLMRNVVQPVDLDSISNLFFFAL